VTSNNIDKQQLDYYHRSTTAVEIKSSHRLSLFSSSSLLCSDLMLKSEPYITVFNPHENGQVWHLLALKNGFSFVSSSNSNSTIIRWSIVPTTTDIIDDKNMNTTSSDSNNNEDDSTMTLRLDCHFRHGSSIKTAIEKDFGTIVFGALRVWDTTTGQCSEVVGGTSAVLSSLKTKDESHLICGLLNGSIEVRRLDDFQLVSSFNWNEKVHGLCELEDGTIMAASVQLKRWDRVTGTVLQTLIGHSLIVRHVIELKKGIIASGGFDCRVKI